MCVLFNIRYNKQTSDFGLSILLYASADVHIGSMEELAYATLSAAVDLPADEGKHTTPTNSGRRILSYRDVCRRNEEILYHTHSCRSIRYI